MTKINKELEVDHFIKTMMQIRVMLKTLFTKTELFLMKNNRKFIVQSDSTENEKNENSHKETPYKSKEKKLGRHSKALLQDCGLKISKNLNQSKE